MLTCLAFTYVTEDMEIEELNPLNDLRRLLKKKYSTLRSVTLSEKGKSWTIIFRSVILIACPLSAIIIIIMLNLSGCLSTNQWVQYRILVFVLSLRMECQMLVSCGKSFTIQLVKECTGALKTSNCIWSSYFHCLASCCVLASKSILKKYDSRPKNLCQWGVPCNRNFSATCYRWHVPCNYKQPHSSTAYDCCKPCKQLMHDIKQLASRATTTTAGRKIARTFPSSNYHLSNLSPTSHKVRVKRIIDERKNMAQKIKKLQPFDCEVNDKQNYELVQLVSEVRKNGSKAVDELLKESDEILGNDNVLRDAWRQDVSERLEFEKDQQNSGSIFCCGSL